MFGILLFAIFLNVGSIVEPGAGADLVILRVAQRRLECCGFVSAAQPPPAIFSSCPRAAVS
jgi:hypothetical protein